MFSHIMVGANDIEAQRLFMMQPLGRWDTARASPTRKVGFFI